MATDGSGNSPVAIALCVNLLQWEIVLLVSTYRYGNCITGIHITKVAMQVAECINFLFFHLYFLTIKVLFLYIIKYVTNHFNTHKINY